MEPDSLPRAPKLRKVLLCKAFFFACDKVADTPPSRVGAAEGCDLLILLLFPAARRDEPIHKDSPMELLLETVALFCMKLAYETEDSSPILRDDLLMSDYEREVFGLLVRRGDVEGIQGKVGECVGVALKAIGGVDKPLGRELQRLSAELSSIQVMELLNDPLTALQEYLKEIQ
jgi:hypothetical protein